MNKAMRKDPGSEDRALQAVEHHHADMMRRLRALVDTLIQAAERRDPIAEHEAKELLVEWCDTELIPHALAEEGPLYGGPRSTEQGRLLVDGMLAEHQVIVGLVEQLRRSDGVRSAVDAGAIQHIFALHLDKENRLLMPLVVQSPEMSLAEAVKGLHELVGEADVHHHCTDGAGGGPKPL